MRKNIVVSRFLENTGMELGDLKVMEWERDQRLKNRIASYLKELGVEGYIFFDEQSHMYIQIENVTYELYDLDFPQKHCLLQHGKTSVKNYLNKIIKDARIRQLRI